MTLVKICGITNLEDARIAVEAGADELGFNFYSKSPRYIEPVKARGIIDSLPENVHKIGVFVNERIERILEIVDIAGLDTIQLHGDEEHSFVSALHRATEKGIIKAIRVVPDLDLADITGFDSQSILIDSFSKDEYGGSGKRFDWKIAKKVCAMVESLYLAGGISVDNVNEAIQEVRPYAIDACSSIESSPGKKDREKLQRLIAAVKANE